MSLWGVTTGFQPLPLFPFPSWEAEAALTTVALVTPYPCQCACTLSLCPTLGLPDLSGIRSWPDCAYSASEVEWSCPPQLFCMGLQLLPRIHFFFFLSAILKLLGSSLITDFIYTQFSATCHLAPDRSLYGPHPFRIIGPPGPLLHLASRRCLTVVFLLPQTCPVPGSTHVCLLYCLHCLLLYLSDP